MSLDAEIVVTRQVMNRDRYRDINKKKLRLAAGDDVMVLVVVRMVMRLRVCGDGGDIELMFAVSGVVI